MVIPVHDINPLRRTPWVTYGLVAINLVVLLLTPVAIGTFASQPGGTAATCKQAAFLDRWAAIPKELTSGHQLALVPTGQVGTNSTGQTGCVVQRPGFRKIPWLSVLWSMFLHAGWLHLLGNMLFLIVFGNNIEDRLRRLPFLIFYLACGFVAAYGFAAAYPTSTEPLIGASGAISGVLGAYIVLYPRARVWSLVPFFFFIPVRTPAWVVLGLWFGLQWVYSAGIATSGAGSVAYLAHVFGFTAGAVLGMAVRTFGPSPPPLPPPRSRYRVV
ncbi:MAG: rhomboid family intramembrane serine protease [Actinobacteria bacterium]|nr:rhomboid family intramembrane serine protease [Actinomycetota bacterium]MBO0836126.1 rhomboid family intramembrane serine protease [Actinomycetota bacterium]